MKFITHNDAEFPGDEAVGTSLVGHIIVDYAKLKKAFGNPTKSDGYKSDAEWEILFEDGTIATIYNYKDGKNYLGKNGKPKTKIRDWHIGGKDEKAYENVLKVLSL